MLVWQTNGRRSTVQRKELQKGNTKAFEKGTNYEIDSIMKDLDKFSFSFLLLIDQVGCCPIERKCARLWEPSGGVKQR